jgi:hypothetical protein
MVYPVPSRTWQYKTKLKKHDWTPSFVFSKFSDICMAISSRLCMHMETTSVNQENCCICSDWHELWQNHTNILWSFARNHTLEVNYDKQKAWSRPQNIVLSGCRLVTTTYCTHISVFPSDLDVSFKRRILSLYKQINHQKLHSLWWARESCSKLIIQECTHVGHFEMVNFGATIDWLKLFLTRIKDIQVLRLFIISIWWFTKSFTEMSMHQLNYVCTESRWVALLVSKQTTNHGSGNHKNSGEP